MMEMRDPSSMEPINAPEEQTLTQPESGSAPGAVDTLNEDITPDPEAQAEEEMTEAIAGEENLPEPREPETKESLIASAREMLELAPADIQRDQLTRLRQHFSNLCKTAIEEARAKWLEEGNDPAEFTETADQLDTDFADVIAKIREKKNVWAAEQEQMRQDNLKEKNSIIDQINALAEDTDNVNRTFNLYRELQDKFNATGAVPPTEETAVWKRFQEARERYSDNLKINKELRDYDFKKNLDSKNAIIAEAQTLAESDDAIAAFRRLQELHDTWRQVGPVAKEIREEIWDKFKEASTAINKKYQAIFEERKAREQKNEEEKTALCEKIEDMDFSALKTFNDWEQMTAAIIELQGQWKTLGYASRKVNNALFSRFRQRCDEFFSAKAEYFKKVKEEYAANLAKKTALCEKAEALMDSAEWRKTTDQLVALQKEWKTIGAVPKRHSDAIWKRFLAACDHFFDKKKEATSGQRSQEQANLKAKKEIIAALASITPDVPDSEAIARLRQLQEQWQQTGHVPFKEKDKVYDAYREAVNALRGRLNLNEQRERMGRFEDNISQLDGDRQKLSRERDRLARALESRRNEIRTYENNIGFLSSKSKSGDGIVAEMRRKVDRLKEDVDQIKEKISIIDSKLDA